MDFKKIHSDIHNNIKKRNVLILISTASVFLNLIFGILLLSIGGQRIVLMPAHLSQAVEISSSTYSNAYLEEISSYYLSFWTDITSANITYKSQLLSRHISSEFLNSFLVQSGKRVEMYKSANLGTAFTPRSFEIDASNLIVRVKGTFTTYLSQSLSSDQEKIFEIRYKNDHGKLLITKIAEFVPKVEVENKK